jgi:hypothetical protein
LPKSRRDHCQSVPDSDSLGKLDQVLLVLHHVKFDIQKARAGIIIFLPGKGMICFSLPGCVRNYFRYTPMRLSN